MIYYLFRNSIQKNPVVSNKCTRNTSNYKLHFRHILESCWSRVLFFLNDFIQDDKGVT